MADEITAGMDALKVQKNEEIKANPRFQPFLNAVKGKGFFNGCEEGSDEYESRMQKLVDKFAQKLEAEPPAEAAAPADEAATPAPRGEYDAATLEQADALKGEGNGALVKKDYARALALYTQALDLCPDGPSSHIYLANRSAARGYLKDFEAALDDAQAAIDLRPDYAKAHHRLGYAHFQLKQYEEAVEAYEELLKLEPGNADGENMRDRAMRELEKQSNLQGGLGAGAGGMPDLSALMGAMGGGGGGMPPGGIGGLMNNPQFMQAAQQMMKNPQMMQMAQKMMQDPNAMQQAMGALGGGGGGGMDPAMMAQMQQMMGGMGGGAAGAGGGAPAGSFGGFVDEDAPAAPAAAAAPPAPGAGMGGAFDDMENSPEMQALKEDPEMAEFFADMEREGPMAAMKHMANPAISSKIMSIMGSMMGGQN